MNQFKDLKLKIDITNKKKRVESTYSLFFSYDINAIRVIADITKNGEVLPDDTKIYLIVQSAHSMSYEPTDSIKIKLDTTIQESKATFELPNEILSYRGFIRLDFYVDFEEGSNDSGQAYVFELRKSQIDQAFDQVEFVYISDFELSKQRVLEAEKQALATIEGVGYQLDATIEETRQAITKRPQELDTTITQAKSDIADKVATVDVSKSQAQTTISSYVANIEQAKTTAETNISDSVKNVSDKQSQAFNSIDIDVSNVQTKQAQTTETFTQAVQDVQQAKSDAQSVIASQTDLSTDVEQAKASMTYSVQSVKDVAMSEIESIQAETVNVQTVADYEKQQIEAIRPKLESDIAFVKENAESIQAKGFLETPKTAWANSRDMLTDFTDVYPSENLIPFDTNKEILINTSTWQQVIYSLRLEEDDWLKTFTCGYYIDMTNATGEGNAVAFIDYIDDVGGFIQYGNSNMVIKKGEKGWLYHSMINNRLTSKNIKPTQVRLVVRSTSAKGFSGGIANKFYLGRDEKWRCYITPKKYDYANSFMKYYATSNINTTDPTKYTQGRYTDEYIDYKLQQLTNAVVTNAGGA